MGLLGFIKRGLCLLDRIESRQRDLFVTNGPSQALTEPHRTNSAICGAACKYAGWLNLGNSGEGLKIRRPSGHGGSIPPPGTIKSISYEACSPPVVQVLAYARIEPTRAKLNITLTSARGPAALAPNLSRKTIRWRLTLRLIPGFLLN